VAPDSARRGGLLTVGVVAVTALALFGLLQLVPYGRPQQYAAGSGEPAWATPRTREIMVAACYDCHSNEVRYPWYSNVAPISWTVQHHIDEARDAVNYSDFATKPGNAKDTIEVIREGSMPPGYFTAFGMHPEAQLSDAEKAELIAGLEATPGVRLSPGER
jgi:mono/diheme cytochrome c family protein